ncbi:MAG: tRNA(fMet)-specific endonuclease VapC [Candidatus Bathyarchaeota archaeon BA2]|nr:MAG: tRNA(fMet)-specific endonuclease VapC [Candidatus Bathyarchaeota archaeon BA2]
MKYLDTNVIIYAIENHPKYGEKCKDLLKDIENAELEVCASTLVLVEVINVLCKLNRILEKAQKKKLNIRKNIDAILSLPIKWVELDFAIIRRASEYQFKVSGIDYVHVASMELNLTNEVISADEELDKIDFIKRIDPLKFG